MISVLRSIDLLLYRFDELSQQHSNAIENFQNTVSETENPLRHVARNDEEQRQTAENVSSFLEQNDDRTQSFESAEEFNRRITRNQFKNRPPMYASNDALATNRVPSRSSMITTESAPPSSSTTTTTKTIQTPIRSSVSQPVTMNTNNEFAETKERLTARVRPNRTIQTAPIYRPRPRPVVTEFTMETINRLSTPKKQYQLIEEKVLPKPTSSRPKPSTRPVREAFQSFASSSLTRPSGPMMIKQIVPVSIKSSSPKKVPNDEKISTENSRKVPKTTQIRPTILLASPPTIRLTFPIQSGQRSTRTVVFPPGSIKIKSRQISPMRKSIIPPNRMIQLMT